MVLQLEQGAISSQLEGPETERLLLIIHGATVPYHWEFDRVIQIQWNDVLTSFKTAPLVAHLR